jgi:hypothetical protein
MSNMYHYATVSKALDDLNEMDLPMIFNIHEDDIVKIQAIMKFNIFIDTKAIVIQMMKQLFMASNQLRVKGVFVAGYAANSENGAARVLMIS